MHEPIVFVDFIYVKCVSVCYKKYVCYLKGSWKYLVMHDGMVTDPFYFMLYGFLVESFLLSKLSMVAFSLQY